MQQRSLSLWQLAGLTFTAVLGTLLHFLYDWTEIISLTPISAVNESTWEHMKILFFPMLFFAFTQSKFFAKEYKNFWQVKCVGITVGTALIPVLFYTYNGAFGVSPDWLNVLIFFLSAFFAYAIEYVLFRKQALIGGSSLWAIIILMIYASAFIVFTYFPPQIPLFQDPISNLYGIR